MDGAGVARVRTWKSVVGDHIKDEDLKTLYRNAYDSCGLKITDGQLFPAVPNWDIVECLPIPAVSQNYDVSSLSCLMHWSFVRQHFTDELHSKLLKMLFYFIEDSPLLLILEDFLPQLDEFFTEQESKLDGYNFSPEIDDPVQSSITMEHKEKSQDTKNGKVVGGVEVMAERVKKEEGEDKNKAKEHGPNIDEDYVHALEMYCLLKQRLLDVRHKWKNVVKEALSDHGKQAGFAKTFSDHIVATLENLVELSEGVLQTLGSKDEQKSIPKFVQLCEKLNLSDKEQDALRYIFIQNVGVLFGKLHSRFTVPVSNSSLGGSRQSSMALSAALFAQLSSKEMLDFFDVSRVHLKQELLEPEDEFSSLQMASFIVMPSSVLKACCGCKLTADDRYKIDKTAMGEIMSGGEEKKMSQEYPEVNGQTRDISGREQDETEEEEEEKEGSGVGIGGRECLENGEDKELSVELEEMLKTCNAIQSKPTPNTSESVSCSDGQPHPYSSDLEYLEDNFQYIETLGKALKIDEDDEPLFHRADQRKPEAVTRELRAKSRSLKAKIDQKMEATKKLEGWLPRLERLAELRRLDQFEKNVLLVLTGSMVSKNLRKTGNSSTAIFGHHLSIGAIIGLFCDGLKEQIESRVYFYKNSKLVSEGLVHVSDPPLHARGNFLDSVVELDRRLLDYIVGLDTEINELVDGSDLYSPYVTLSDVALPQDHKQLLLSTFKSFTLFQKTCKELGLSTKGTSKGLCLLFYGPSGTGKTMTANAVANYLKKKILLITVSLLTDKELTKDLLRFLFREAKIHNAVLFFDECESLFESRDLRSSPTLGILLTEIEQYSGVIILATNRHQDLDEAMHRRIQLALPFSVPDYALREEIWKSHVPSAIASKDINWRNLALSHELTGGLICNAVLSALSLAMKECSENEKPALTEVFLIQGAKLQLRGLLEMVDFENRVIPTFGIQDLVLEDHIHQQLQLVLNAGKTHKFISAQWGFGGVENVAKASGMTCLICGNSGSGKTAIARVIAYELGQPIKEANCTELLSHTVSFHSKANRGVVAFFKDAQKANAIIVLDGSEIMLSNTGSNLLSGIVGCQHQTLMHQIEHFSGIVILTSRYEFSQLDLNRMPKLKYVLELNLPTTKLREKLWRKLLPKKAPISGDIDYHELAERFQFTGGNIASAICHSAELCAMQAIDSPPLISHDNLVASAEFESNRKLKRTFVSSLFS